MDFEEAQERLKDLVKQRNDGTLSGERFSAAINELRVTDASGTVWQPDIDGVRWIFWNGKKWEYGTPPEAAAMAPPPAAGEPKEAAARKAAAPAAAGAGKAMPDLDTFRKTARTVPWSSRPPGWWDLFSILGGTVLAVAWFLYAGIRGQKEGYDLLTPLILIGLPIALVLFRREFDDLLMPLQPLRQRVPRLLLLGLGLAVPFLTAFILYEALSVDNYPLVQWNVLAGPLAAYAIMHDPETGTVSVQPARPVNGSLKVPLLLFFFCMFCIRVVFADHCATDPFNAQDCLRSGGFAPSIAGGAAAFEAGFVFGKPYRPKPPRELPDFDRNAKPPKRKPGGDGIEKAADFFWGMARDTSFDVLNPFGGSQVINATKVLVDIAQTDSPRAAQEAAARSLVNTLGVAAPPGLEGYIDDMINLRR